MSYLEKLIFNPTRNSKLYLKHNMKQSPWLSKYFNSSTSKRKEETSEFELGKNFSSLQTIICFGKAIENVRERLDIKFIKDGSLVILVLGPTSVRSIIIYHGLIAIQ